jgi:hypothetical protein
VSAFEKKKERSTEFLSVRNLMYGFGDDRNPANDAVNIMEEILIKYIVDVVSCLSSGHPKLFSITKSNPWHPSVQPH